MKKLYLEKPTYNVLVVKIIILQDAMDDRDMEKVSIR
jgi:hypothetical protein